MENKEKKSNSTSKTLKNETSKKDGLKPRASSKISVGKQEKKVVKTETKTKVVTPKKVDKKATSKSTKNGTNIEQKKTSIKSQSSKVKSVISEAQEIVNTSKKPQNAYTKANTPKSTTNNNQIKSVEIQENATLNNQDNSEHIIKISTENKQKNDTRTSVEKVENSAQKTISNNNQNLTTNSKENVEKNNKIKVLYVVSECHPFCATGGLADVAEGLPKFINKNSNIDMRVVLPMYSDIPSEYRDNFKFLGWKNVPVAWRNVYCGVFTYTLNGVTYYFLDNEYYFKRGGGIYSYFDDGERFAFTSRAVLECISIMDFEPDIIHSNDWQSALIPIYLKTIYVNNPSFDKIKTVFTLHNTEYQGKFDLKIISDLFGIDVKYTSLLEYNKDLNLVKGAICCCDKFTTVSPSYAREILSPEHSNGLDSILRQNSYKICGILNAIDCEFYNPKTDNVLYKNYDVNSFKNKVINKTEIQKEFGLEVNREIPMMCIVTRMAKHKGLDLIKTCMEGVLQSRPVQFIAVGGGDKEYEDYFRYLQGKYPNKVKALLGYSNIMGRKAYGASDIFIMPSKSEPCGLSQMVASRYGAIPIVRETGGLKDSMWDFGCEGGGNAYTFRNYNIEDLVYSITRALNDYNNKETWYDKIKICMNRDFSWKVSSNDYINMYNELIK